MSGAVGDAGPSHHLLEVVGIGELLRPRDVVPLHQNHELVGVVGITKQRRTLGLAGLSSRSLFVEDRLPLCVVLYFMPYQYCAPRCHLLRIFCCRIPYIRDRGAPKSPWLATKSKADAILDHVCLCCVPTVRAFHSLSPLLIGERRRPGQTMLLD